MDFEQQKPITDEFRKGWERIYAQQEARKSQVLQFCTHMDPEVYPNGCPILSDGPQKDDL